MTEPQSAERITTQIFAERAGLDFDRCTSLCQETLKECDHGELYLEHTVSEVLSLDDQRIRTASFDCSEGFGLRAVKGEATAYAHANQLDLATISNAADCVKAVGRNYQGRVQLDQTRLEPHQLYPSTSPVEIAGFEEKTALLQEIDRWTRGRDPRINQVSASLATSWQAVRIIRADGHHSFDIRPLIRLGVTVNIESNGRMELGSSGAGGRSDFLKFLQPDHWQAQADEALRQALVNLEAGEAPGGEMIVVLGPGWPGVLLHEAVGHGLEGDFNRKQISAFSKMMGEQVAARGVTVVDDGTIAGRRGSLNIDDEGTPTSSTTLIEDGILTQYLQDRMNAGLMGETSTGNGRRESFEYAPMPRMTNTFMLGGDKSPEEIIASVPKGVYAVQFGGGQVDITNGQFVFSCTEAYRIENGKIGAPIKGATLIGNGPESMRKITMIGNDMALDSGIGTCGKDGQSVPVGVGQPTLRLDGITVGGTGGS